MVLINLKVTLGPALAPIIAGFSISAKNWQWEVHLKLFPKSV